MPEDGTGAALALARALEERILRMECKGLCVYSCEPFRLPPAEERVIEDHCRRQGIEYHPLDATVPERLARQRAGAPFEQWACPYLREGRCGIHPARPTVCRLWGAVRAMPCPHGCEPPGGPLTVDEGLLLSYMAAHYGQTGGT